MRQTYLSEAVLLWLDYGVSSFPRHNKDLVTQRFSGETGELLKKAVAELLREVDAIEVEWSSMSLVEAGVLVRSTIASRHPDLSNDALDAISWYFTYNWR